MKWMRLGVVIVALFIVSGCGKPRVIEGVEYDTYGILNEDDKKNPDIYYEPIVGNIIWGAFFVVTIVTPVYFFGFDLFQPVCKKAEVKGARCKK